MADDGSADQTVSLLQSWMADMPFPVRILVNEQNLGSTRNFERAALACTGDIIVFSDQDDAWREDRLAQITAFFRANPAAEAVFSDAEIMDDQSALVGRRIWEEVGFDAVKQAQWLAGDAHNLLIKGYLVTGATLAIRRDLVPLATPFPTHVPYLLHDGWLSLLATGHGRMGFINDALVRYRQHGHQQVGFIGPGRVVTLRDRMARPRSEKQGYLQQEAQRVDALYTLLMQQPGINQEKFVLLRRQKDHYAHRASLPVGRFSRIGPVFREVMNGNYSSFHGHWWLTVFGDLLEQ